MEEIKLFAINLFEWLVRCVRKRRFGTRGSLFIDRGRRGPGAGLKMPGQLKGFTSPARVITVITR